MFFKRNAGKVVFEKGMNALRNADYQAAIASFSQIIDKDPGHVLAYYQRSVAYEKLGELKAALADAQAALKLAPDMAVAKMACITLQSKLEEES